MADDDYPSEYNVPEPPDWSKPWLINGVLRTVRRWPDDFLDDGPCVSA